MAQLEDLKPNAAIRGILPNGLVTVVNVQWHGSAALELTYKTPEGRSRTNFSIGMTSRELKLWNRVAPGASMEMVSSSG